MDYQIRRLPESLHLYILAHLSLPDICRYRAVSKRWNKALSSPTFLKLHTEVSTPRNKPNWILSHYTGNEFWIFYAGDGQWRRVASDFLGTCYRTSAQGAGLLGAHQDSFYRWLVGNPLSGRWKVITQTSENFYIYQTLGIVPGPGQSKTKPYRILALTKRHLIVYFSERDKWKKRDVPHEIHRYENDWSLVDNCVSFYRELVMCAGPFIRFPRCESDESQPPIYVWSYHVEKDVWKQLNAGPLPRKLALPKSYHGFEFYPVLVHAGDGSLVLAGGCSNNSGTDIENAMVLWRLENRDWVEIARAPELMSQQLLEAEIYSRRLIYPRVKYGGNSSMVFASSSWGNMMLCYEFGPSGRWSWLAGVKPMVPSHMFADEDLRSMGSGFYDDLTVCLEAGDTCADHFLAPFSKKWTKGWVTVSREICSLNI